jgi:ferredoxin-NADP reductase/predicted pyridoxine 5'-phosphate oxidase superfamily flavin-nucleotide-binding protein
MARAFASITFTPAVKAAQERHGSREGNRSFELTDDAGDRLTDREAEFIGQRDSFYMATVSESGWPYVQHRGGPPGFLKVLDDKTIGFADFRGNRQYLSVGNLAVDDRVALILMDYPNRRRLKVWGCARIIDDDGASDLLSELEVADYRARVERGIVIEVLAYDWNCPQHITPRYKDSEINELFAPLKQELDKLRSARVSVGVSAALGDGSLPLAISGIRQLTPRIRAYELRHAEGGTLPAVLPGAHLRVPVVVGGKPAWRHYSIVSSTAEAYEIAILREPEGGGGSIAAHEMFQLGTTLRCGMPRTDFPVHADGRPALLFAGGIGITPIKAITTALAARGVGVRLHYAARSMRDLAYRDELQARLAEKLSCYASDKGERMDIKALVSSAGPDTLLYACGPQRMLEAVTEAASSLGVSPDRMHIERFSAGPLPTDREHVIELKRTGKRVTVASNETFLEAIRKAGVPALSDCTVGTCGTCAVRVLDGEPEHRDSALAADDRARGLMCVCVSRAYSDRLVLDL